VLPPRDKHPTIFHTFDGLASGVVMAIINDHDPRPLRYQLAAERASQFDRSGDWGGSAGMRWQSYGLRRDRPVRAKKRRRHRNHDVAARPKWAREELNLRPHAYQLCKTQREVRQGVG